jgi:D-alanyl-D-alanine carboxypeptidase (penicillin-binding protein 5/6)
MNFRSHFYFKYNTIRKTGSLVYKGFLGGTMRKLNVFILTFILISGLKLQVTAITPRPAVSADGAILMDATTGKILYSKNIDTAYPPASTTKIMTALLTLENCKMEDRIVVGEKPPKTEGNNIALFSGEEFCIEDMLYALINESANDCANALAEHISGSVEAFAERMNNRAREIGCKNTNFVNPNGLYDKNHRTSARDLALIMRELVKDDRFRTVATTYRYDIQPTNKTPRERVINNHNKLVVQNSGYYYEDCEGGKTGYTIQSKHSYVASAMRDGHRLIVALVHDSQKTFYKDTINLFNYGFSNYKLEKIYSRGEVVGENLDGDGSQLTLKIGEDFYYLRGVESNGNLDLNIDINKSNVKELNNGEKLIRADVILDGNNIGNIMIRGLNDRSDQLYKDSSKKFLTNFSSTADKIQVNWYMRNGLIILGSLAAICLVVYFKIRI